MKELSIEERAKRYIVLEDFNGGEGFYKLHLDYLNKKQVEEIEKMIRTWNKESILNYGKPHEHSGRYYADECKRITQEINKLKERLTIAA